MKVELGGLALTVDLRSDFYAVEARRA